MQWRTPLVITLALFVAASCDQQPVEPSAEQVAEAPAFNFSNNDGWINDKVYRHPHGVSWFGWDAKSELLGVFTTSSGDWCGTGVDLDPVDSQHVFKEAAILIQMGEVAVQLYDWTGQWDLGNCANYAPNYMGEGRVRVITTDNDQFHPGTEHMNNNAWGFKANGYVDFDADGMTILNYVFRMTWNNDKPNEHITEWLKITSDPR